jgi:ABC-2 type transport system permease protein
MAGHPFQATVRGYWKTAAIAAVEPVNEGPLFLADLGLRLIRVLVLLAIWRGLLEGRPPASGMSLSAVLTYTLIAEVFHDQLNVTTRLQEHIWNGTIAGRFLWPMGLVGQMASELAGRWSPGLLLCSLPLLAAAPLLGVDPRPATPLALAAFALSLGLGIAVGLAIDFAFAVVIVRTGTSIWLVQLLRAAVTSLLSGALLPLALLPWGLGNVFAWLPFAAMASAPLRVYTQTGPTPALLAGQVAWVAILWPTVWWLWRRSREKVVGYGG